MQVYGDKIRLKDFNITYEYDKNDWIGIGTISNVFKGNVNALNTAACN